MWIVLGFLAALPMLAILVVRLFFFEQWTIVKLDWHTAFGRSDRALPLVKDQFARLCRTKGENHIDANVARYNLGRLTYEFGNKDEGSKLVNTATDFFASYQGKEDSHFATYLINLALAQRTVERKDQAIDSIRRALLIEQNRVPVNEYLVDVGLMNLATFLSEVGQNEEAFTLFGETLQKRMAKHGENSQQTAEVRVNRAEAFIDLQNWMEAERDLRKAIEVLKNYPTQDIGQAYDTYAKVLEAQDRLSEAEPMRDASITALQRALGNRSTEVAKQMERQAALLGRMNRPTEQRLYEQRAAEIRQELKCTVS